jgi:hypothetical protein
MSFVDRWAEGGIGEAVLSALAQASVAPAKSQLIAAREMPHSGKPDELIDAFGISAKHIVEVVHAIYSKPSGAPSTRALITWRRAGARGRSQSRARMASNASACPEW